MNPILKSAIKGDIADVDKALSLLVKPSSKLTHDVYRQVVENGKRLRPLIVLYSALASGYKDRESAVVLGCIVELIHTASLLHDDIIDGADYRRGKEAANVVYGVNAAVLGGDYLYSLAFNRVLDFDTEIARVISKAAYLLAEGEIQEIENAFKADIDRESYYEVIYRKTAVLLEASAESGALLAGGEFRDNLKNYGRDLGFAFQIKDDCLDYGSDLEKLGKDVGIDLKEGKVTLPVFCAIERDASIKDLVGKFFEERDEGILVELLKRVREIGLEPALDEAKRYASRAKEALNPLKDGRFKEYLLAIADYSVERTR